MSQLYNVNFDVLDNPRVWEVGTEVPQAKIAGIDGPLSPSAGGIQTLDEALRPKPETESVPELRADIDVRNYRDIIVTVASKFSDNTLATLEWLVPFWLKSFVGAPMVESTLRAARAVLRAAIAKLVDCGDLVCKNGEWVLFQDKLD